MDAANRKSEGPMTEFIGTHECYPIDGKVRSVFLVVNNYEGVNGLTAAHGDR
jgi:hypothetical protein